MYSWGGDTDNWKGSGSYDFDSARKPYLDKLAADAGSGPRTYNTSRDADMKLVGPNGKTISSDSKNPIILGVDVTGSMSTWPAEIFDRLPLLYQTLSQYKEDVELAICAIGDAYVDQYPLQVNHFGKALELEEHLKAIGAEGGGGGQVSETYELFGHFMQNHCDIPNAESPFLIMFGDEKFYNTIDRDQIKHYIGDDVPDSPDANAMWQDLMLKFNVYFLQKPYGSRGGTTREVKDHWARALGDQRVIDLPSRERAVDVAIGLIARHWGQYGDFTDNMGARQDSDEIKSVDKSLRFVPNTGVDPITRRSRLLASGKGSKSVRLDKIVSGGAN